MQWSWEYFFQYLFSGYMVEGVWTTVWLAVVSMIIGVTLGVVLAFMKMSQRGKKTPHVRWE